MVSEILKKPSPLAHWLFHIDPSVVAKQPNGTPDIADPAWNTSGPMLTLSSTVQALMVMVNLARLTSFSAVTRPEWGPIST